MSNPGEQPHQVGTDPQTVIERGFDAADLPLVAGLYDEAFGAKIAVAIPDPAARRAVIEAGLRPGHSLVAKRGSTVIGVAGFQDASGAFTGGITPASLRRELGIRRAVRALLVLSLLERRAGSGVLLMDGIAVSEQYRGEGAGSALLRALIAYARSSGYRSIRLDVIDTNVAARRLYEQIGFVPTRTSHFPYLRWLLGFGASTQMVFRVADHPATAPIAG